MFYNIATKNKRNFVSKMKQLA